MFVGAKGTEIFFKETEGVTSETLKLIKRKNADELLFSKFIQKELKELEAWYNTKPDSSKKEERLKQIQVRFDQLRFQTDQYKHFSELKLNNAILLGYKTYVNDLSEFERVYSKSNNMKDFLNLIRTIEDSKNPSVDIKKL
jgi:hypothetical protein